MKEKKVYSLNKDLKTDMTFAIFANADRLTKHKHAWQAWRALKEFGCRVYLVAEGVKYFEGVIVYPTLEKIPVQVDVVVPCLRGEHLASLIVSAHEIGAKYIWFQENNWSESFQKECLDKGIGVVRGCVLKFKKHSKPLAYLNPCYWHGLGHEKVPSKVER